MMMAAQLKDTRRQLNVWQKAKNRVKYISSDRYIPFSGTFDTGQQPWPLTYDHKLDWLDPNNTGRTTN